MIAPSTLDIYLPDMLSWQKYVKRERRNHSVTVRFECCYSKATGQATDCCRSCVQSTLGHFQVAADLTVTAGTTLATAVMAVR